MVSNRSIRGILPAGLLILCQAGTAIAAESPWRLNEALGLQNGFSIGLIHRSRFETLANNVQPGTSKHDQVLAQRTLLDMRYRTDGFQAQLELADMRQQLMDRDSVISTGTVNSLDILQANLGYRFGETGNTLIRFGRFSEDWGSRRLVGRNRYRNTINAWDGLVVHHQAQNGIEYRLMATQVVQRLPADRQRLLDNSRESDESSSAERFYGVFAVLPELAPGFTTELYFYKLREKDTSDANTRNRHLDSFGLRLLSEPGTGEFDFEVESVLQFGSQRGSSSPLDRVDLDHRALFQYLALGYSFEMPGDPRLVLEFDYASGDEDLFDGDSGRFDSLFGPTTFEFGVVGLYNPFSRSNLISPGLRLFADLSPEADLMVSYRHFWLAQDRDSWGRTGLRDVTGQSGDYLGQHLQFRLRWNIVPGNVDMESGAIFLDADSLSDRNSRYGYIGFTFTF